MVENTEGTWNFGDTIEKELVIENTGTRDAFAKISWDNLINTINTYLADKCYLRLQFIKISDIICHEREVNFMKNDLKRRTAALFGAAIFLLTGCSLKGKTSEEVELSSIDAINALLDDVKPIDGDKIYNGEDIKIFASFDPTLETYRYNVLEKSDKEEEEQPIRDIIDMSFGHDIPYETLSTMYTDCTFETTSYEDVSDNSASASVTTVSLNSEGYVGYSEIIEVTSKSDSEDYVSQTKNTTIQKDGEVICDKNENLVIKNGEFFDDNFACNYQFPESTGSYISLSSDKTYSQTQLDFLQERLDELTMQSSKNLDDNQKTK